MTHDPTTTEPLAQTAALLGMTRYTLQQEATDVEAALLAVPDMCRRAAVLGARAASRSGAGPFDLVGPVDDEAAAVAGEQASEQMCSQLQARAGHLRRADAGIAAGACDAAAELGVAEAAVLDLLGPVEAPVDGVVPYSNWRETAAGALLDAAHDQGGGER